LNVVKALIFEGMKIVPRTFLQGLLKNIPPFNAEMLIEKPLSIVEKLRSFQWDIFIEPPDICLF